MVKYTVHESTAAIYTHTDLLTSIAYLTQYSKGRKDILEKARNFFIDLKDKMLTIKDINDNVERFFIQL